MRTSAFFGAKNFGCFEIYGVSARTMEEAIFQCGHWASTDIFRTRKEGVNFSRFCVDVFYGRLL